MEKSKAKCELIENRYEIDGNWYILYSVKREKMYWKRMNAAIAAIWPEIDTISIGYYLNWPHRKD